MKASDIPSKFTIPFAANAGAGFIRTIPAASQIGIVAGAASLNDGFVPLNATQLASGGIPPSIQDTNGILYQMSAWDRWTAAGGLAPYDSAFATAIGGYPQGATVLSATTIGRVWVSTADNNTVNPDSVGQTAWLALMLSADILAIIAANKIGIQNPLPPVITPGTYTYTASSPTVRAILVKGQAPGGGGSASSNTSSSQASVGVPGGGGGYFEHYMTSGFSGASYTVGASGAGGTVVSGVGQAGFPGGTTSFAGGPTAQGGFGGAQTYPVTVPAYSNTAAVSGGVVSGGNLVNRPGGASQASQYLGSTAYGGQGGSSQNGSSGLALATTGPGSSGAGFGAGGTPGVTEPNAASQLGGAGGGGFIQITEIF